MCLQISDLRRSENGNRRDVVTDYAEHKRFTSGRVPMIPSTTVVCPLTDYKRVGQPLLTNRLTDSTICCFTLSQSISFKLNGFACVSASSKYVSERTT